MKSLEAALEVFEGVSMAQLRQKSVSLTSLFIELAQEHLVSKGFTIRSPLSAEDRGSHVALGFADGKPLVDAMAAEGIVADFRPPDLMRFGFAPLYNRHTDVVRLIKRLADH
jgi:kynureninase